MKQIIIIILSATMLLHCSPSSNTDENINSHVDIKNNTPITTNKDTISQKKENNTTEKKEDSFIAEDNHHLNNEKDLSELKYLHSFVPKGFLVLDYAYGDLNKDNFNNDVILIAHDAEAEKNMEENIDRPLFILTRNKDNTLKNQGRNDKIVLCYDCGGVMGDPYQDIAIKNGYFSIEHYGGSSWRWTEIITFKYNEEEKNWFLHKKGGESFHTAEPENSKETVKTVKDFGKISFQNYNL